MKRIQLKNSILQEVAREAALTLTNGGLVVAPFDTVYGILMDPTNNTAVAKVNEVKGRPRIHRCENPREIYVYSKRTGAQLHFKFVQTRRKSRDQGAR